MQCLQQFLQKAFFQSSNDCHNNDSNNAYALALQNEKANYERCKSTLLELQSDHVNVVGWAYNNDDDTPAQLPSVDAIANSVQRDWLDGDDEKKKQLQQQQQQCDIGAIVNAAMSTMMNECGKHYLSRVGGKVYLDRESVIVATLDEQIESVTKKMAASEATTTENGDATNEGTSGSAADENKEGAGSEEVDNDAMDKLTIQMKELTTQENTEEESIRIRILSVCPVKKSKRRGDIGARIELVLYPPDPCVLYKEVCGEVGQLVLDRFAEKNVGKEEGEVKADNTQDDDTANKEATGKPQSQQSTSTTRTTVPNFPRLSPAERSRAIARSRILMDRTISAMKIYASSNTEYASWEIFESSSQKTWKSPSCDIVPELMNGVPLRTLLSDRTNEGTKPNTKARGDRFDSTIENSQDYKSFMESYSTNGTAIPTTTTTVAPPEKSQKTDEEGRPLSAIVQHLQNKREEEARIKKEAAAAASRARAKASAEAAREKARKRELENKTKKAKARMKREEERRKKVGATNEGGGGVGSGGGGAPVLLKKGGSLPVSGFSSR